jgi:triacylglycerol esterase/lipase EstA (alpha/beta hydrolase family)
MSALRLLLVPAAVVIGCVVYVLFTYALAFGKGPRPPALVKAMGIELLSVTLLMVFWPLWMVLGGSYQIAEPGRGKRRPVILLHGFAMNRTQWLWLGRRLARRGVGPLYGTSYFSPQSVATSARHLQRFIARVMAREDAERVDIVAHSLGGVVARYYLEKLGGAEHVGRLLTIASPHKGTRLGRLGLGLVPSAREILEESQLFAELGPPPEPVAYSSLWSRTDAIIIPAESSSVAPNGVDRVFDDLGHLTMLLSPRVVDTLVERLSA